MSSPNRLPRLAGSRRLAALLLPAALLAAPNAAADGAFPAKLAADLKMPCVPSCAVCHLDANGGPARLRMTTAGDPGLGLAYRDNFGLDAFKPDTLEPTLQAAKAAGSDIDHDGVPDVDELAAGLDPNDPAVGATVCGGGAAPVYGCAHVAPQGPVDGVAGLAGAAVLVLGVAAFRRRRPR